MKFKRMPVIYGNISSPIFIILSTFLMCGAVIGAFSSINVPFFNELSIEYEMHPKSFATCFIDALKFNFILLIFSRFSGFLLPFYVLIRGYSLSFSISLLYINSSGFFDKSVLFESISYHLIAIPCFLSIATICFNSYIDRKNLKSKRAYFRAYSNNKIIFLLILVNFMWNIGCMMFF